ncbi:MAG: hypothetical protein PF446_11755, partial [Oleiagrimonas sp.]|nr:hypothetical protein [Oleiagrimonas sp.]
MPERRSWPNRPTFAIRETETGPHLRNYALSRLNAPGDHMSQDILVLYYSRNGSTAKLARLVARGIEE